MKRSRRDAIKAGVAAGAALITDFGWLAGTCDASSSGALARAIAPAVTTAPVHAGLTRALFEARVGDLFRVSHAGTPIDLRLAHVADVPCAHAAGTAGHPHCFTVAFHGPAAAPLAQSTYRMDNGVLGTLDLFVVPGSTGEHATYLATFNQVVPESHGRSDLAPPDRSR